MDGLLDRRTQLAQGLLSNPEMAQMGPEVPWYSPAALWQQQLAQRAKNVAGLLDPGSWIKGIATLPNPMTDEGLVQARGLLGNYEDMFNLVTNIAPFGMTVFHGSPHKWAPEPDFPAGRPRLDKIGTGEGAQAYGHGVYFAESPGVAKSYQFQNVSVDPSAVKYANKRAETWYNQALADQDFAIRRNDQKAINEANAKAYFWEQVMTRQHPDAVIQRAASDDGWPELAAYAQSLKREKFNVPRAGEMYALDLPDERLPNLLDWDKPLSQQPEKVRKALSRMGFKDVDYNGMKVGDGAWTINRKGEEYFLTTEKQPGTEIKIWDDMWKRLGLLPPTGRGSSIYSEIIGEFGPEEAAKTLMANGIPGLSYLDAASRGAGEGTKNFVIWDQGLLDEMGRRMAKQQGLLPETIPDELPSWAPAERMAQWRTARANAALPVEQGGLGLGPANTAAERAAALGFTPGDWYHGSLYGGIERFRPSKYASTEGHSGAGIYLTDSPLDASQNYAALSGPDIINKATRKAEEREKNLVAENLFLMGRGRDVLTPERQEKIIKGTGIGDSLGTVYPVRASPKKTALLSEGKDSWIQPAERYNEATDEFVPTRHAKQWQRALEKIEGASGEDAAKDALYEIMTEGANSRDIYNAIVKNIDYMETPKGEIMSPGTVASNFLKEFGIDSVAYKPSFKDSDYSNLNLADTHMTLFSPSKVRSRFAAFDPKRRNEADLLASWLLPVLFGGGAAGAGLFGQPQAD